MNNEKDIGGLWENTSAKGVKYFGGTINGVKVVVFKNNHKQPGEKGPDWRIYESKPQEGQVPRSAPPVDDDIPF